uniref:Fatty acyl-CoA reductase n=1 Tax=Oryza rufipogon TaxID=4529 RepID=A0A0E0PMM1_ORYRU
METGGIAERFRDKTILITGATGFLGKLLVEKILRVQPEVRKLYLLVRAPDAIAAEERVLTEVVGKGLFDVLREQYGAGFNSFIKEKIYALPGDVMHENFGLESYEVLQLSKKVDIIVNGAATTNFMERYDVALATNAAGVMHLCQFAKQCDNLKMVLHVSTAYVAGEQAGQLLEKPFQIGRALRLDYQLDIEAELQLVDSIKSELRIKCSSDDKLEKTTMRKLGLKRTIDVIFVAYNDQTLPCFIFDGSVIFDLMMRAANVLLGGIYTKNYYEFNRDYNILMTVAKLFAPYVFFKGW